MEISGFGVHWGKNMQKGIQNLSEVHYLSTCATTFSKYEEEKDAQKKTTCTNSALRKLTVRQVQSNFTSLYVIVNTPL